MSSYFLSCDWGTSSFRLKLVNQRSGEILSVLKQPQGIKRTYEQWELQLEKSKLSYFQDVLQAAISEMSHRLNEDLKGLPLVISGMASSSIGMKELPYTQLPIPLDGSKLVFEILAADNKFQHTTYLISGLQKNGDVLRGEEMQAIGWNQVSAFMPRKCILIIPGTHSKHLLIEDNQIVDFKTYMTGELYELISQHSVLKSSIQLNTDWTSINQKAFADGVKAAEQGNLGNLLFSVRAKSLEGSLSPSSAAFYLSGLLIGNELKESTSCPIVLCCSSKFDKMYQSAINLLPGNQQTIKLSPESVEDLVVWGQMALLER